MMLVPRRGGTEILVLLTFTALWSFGALRAQTTGAQVKTDRSTYAPGQIAKINGAGFKAGESVDLTITHSVAGQNTPATHAAGKAVVDKKGLFLSQWTMCPDAPYGSDVKLTAKGKSSGATASSSFKSIPASSEKIEAWFNLTDDWGGTVTENNSIYFEDEFLPLRFSAVVMPGSTHRVVLRYVSFGKAQKRFIDRLGDFNVDEEPDPGPFDGFTVVEAPATVAIPSDGGLASGNLRVLNVEAGSLTFEPYGTDGSVRTLPVNFKAAGSGTSPVTVVLAYGAHFGIGSSQFSGASPKAEASLDGQAAVNVSINLPAIVPVDGVPPTAICPADIVVGTDPGQCGAVVEFTSTVTDNNPGATIVCDPPSGSVFAVGTTTVTCTATDEAGNVDLCTFTVTVNDDEAPELTVQPPEVVPNGEGCSTLGTLTASATDNCTAAPIIQYFIGDTEIQSSFTFPAGITEVRIVATDDAGNSSERQLLVNVSNSPNITWPAGYVKALDDHFTAVPEGGGIRVALESQCINELGQSRWYKFKVNPASRVVVILKGLPENYDLVLFKDIAQAYQELTTEGDLVRLNAEFASDAFSPAQFAADAFSAINFSATAFSPAQFSPAQFSPAQFSPAQFSPAQFSPAQFAPDDFAPAQFSPAQFSPAQFSPAQFSPAQFSSAQIQSVIAISAFDGTASEGVVANTWNNSGDFYIRVKGRNGVFSEATPFELEVYTYPGACDTVVDNPTPGLTSNVGLDGSDRKTIILWDSGRLPPGTDIQEFEDKLDDLAAATAGEHLDLADDPVVKDLHEQADANPGCPYAKNLVAEAIKAVIDRSRPGNALEYVVLIGDDGVIPFFRHPDQVLLGPEKNYFPPVLEASASQASLRLNYFLSQDKYGSECTLSLKVGELPLPGLAIGRLVSTPAEIMGMIDAFLAADDNGVKGQISPQQALVTGYDFVSDVASEIGLELAAGLGGTTGPGATVDTELIADASWSPFDPRSWNAAQLSAKLTARRDDIRLVLGHFSAVAALAADFESYILSSEVEGSSADFFNTLFVSIGCHSGYNIVDGDAIPLVTLEPDWVQVIARKQGMALVGTGYQYGDTDFVEYSERLYASFIRQLRTGTAGSGIPIGKALIAAKTRYLMETAQMRGIHEKSLLQATLYGLPMFKVNMPGARVELPEAPSVAGDPQPTAHAWQVNDDAPLDYSLGLESSDVCLSPTVIQETEVLTDAENDVDVNVIYFRGDDGVVSNPMEPVLPASVYDVTADGTVLRGIGFRGGAYHDVLDVIPLTGAAVTELRGVHTAFLSPVFYPPVPWAVNYFDIACQSLDGETRLVTIPAQFRSSAPGSDSGTFRVFDQMCFRLFYSSDIGTVEFGGQDWQPGLAAPPSITGVSGDTVGDEILVSAFVTGSPPAGIQEVWVTVTSASNGGAYAGQWVSFPMAPDDAVATLWKGTIPLNGAASENLRFIVQAANGVGLVSLVNNQGRYYVADQTGTGGDIATEVVGLAAEKGGAVVSAVKYNESVTLKAQLRLEDGGAVLPGKVVLFKLGDQGLYAVTGSDGWATATLRVRSVPRSDYELQASFPGDETHASSHSTIPFEILKQDTTLTLHPQVAYAAPGAETGVSSVLLDATGASVLERTVVFRVTSHPAGPVDFASAAITDILGRSRLLQVPPVLPIGPYTVTASFAGSIALPNVAVPIEVEDEVYNPSSTTGWLVIDNPPTATPASLGPPNHKLVPVSVTATFSDPLLAYAKVVDVTSDEPVNGLGDGDASPDSVFTDTAFYPNLPIPPSGTKTVVLTLELRAERAENDRFGPGRTYTIYIQGFAADGTPRGITTVQVFVSQ